MITAELDYNPYLLSTKIKFNGILPRVNSQVEKYQNVLLQDWINKIPFIFHDEMNGYDFVLEFSGTDLDFEELKKAFSNAGVGENLVHLLHKNKLDSRLDKINKIDELLEWISQNTNRNFDLLDFQKENIDLFEGAYSFIIIQGRPVDISMYENTDIEVEKIEKIEELKHTDLKNTPILFYINRDSLANLQKNIKFI